MRILKKITCFGYGRFKSTYDLINLKPTTTKKNIPFDDFCKLTITNVSYQKSIIVGINNSREIKISFNYPESHPKLTGTTLASHLFFTSSRWHNYAGLVSVCTGNNIKLHIQKNMYEFCIKSCGYPSTSIMELKPEKLQIDNLSVKTVLFHPNNTSENPNWAAAYVMTLTPEYHVYRNTSKEKHDNQEECEAAVSKAKCNLQEAIDKKYSEDKVTFMVIEVPSELYLESLLKQKEFDEHYYHKGCVTMQPKLIIHFIPDHVMKHPQYLEFISRFPSTSQHVIVNGKEKWFGYEKFLNSQTMMKIFCPLIQETFIDRFYKEIPKNSNDADSVHNTFNVNSLFLIKLIGNEFKYKRIFHKLNSRDAVINLMSMDKESIDTLDQLQEEHDQNISTRKANKRLYPNITFLGTSATLSTCSRSESAYIIEYSEEKYALLECGVGTWHQMILLYGYEKAINILKKIRFVFCSHAHVDHYEGLYTLLWERRKAFERYHQTVPMFTLMTTRSVISGLKVFHSNVTNILNQNLHIIALRNSEFYVTECGLSIRTVLVNHSCHAFGIALKYDGVKIVFSGDTGPSGHLVKLGRDCDILIHESTHSDGQEARSKETGHSTVSQAINIGQHMNAKEIYLTHFGSSKLFPITNEAIPDNVAHAFDFMKKRCPFGKSSAAKRSAVSRATQTEEETHIRGQSQAHRQSLSIQQTMEQTDAARTFAQRQEETYAQRQLRRHAKIN